MERHPSGALSPNSPVAGSELVVLVLITGVGVSPETQRIDGEETRA